MSVMVLRKSVDDERIKGPFSCADPKGITRVIGVLTLSERVANLLATNETLQITDDGHAKIFRGEDLVGYIVVLSNE